MGFHRTVLAGATVPPLVRWLNMLNNRTFNGYGTTVPVCTVGAHNRSGCELYRKSTVYRYGEFPYPNRPLLPGPESCVAGFKARQRGQHCEA